MIFYGLCFCAWGFFFINWTLKFNNRIPTAKYIFFRGAELKFKTLHLWNLELEYYLCQK